MQQDANISPQFPRAVPGSCKEPGTAFQGDKTPSLKSNCYPSSVSCLSAPSGKILNGTVIATFVYDGDGNRVKATVGGVTTSFVGNYFEWHTDANDKVRYYYAGGQRIAMRQGNNVPTSNLTYLFGVKPLPYRNSAPTHPGG